MSIKEAKSDEEIMGCWDVASQLYLATLPLLKHEEFLSRIRSQQNEGYRLLFIESELGTGKAAAILGYRILNFLLSGKTLYIDDLSTMPSERGKGYGSRLLDHTKAIAEDTGCEHITLDSGYMRNDSHRLYLNKGFVLYSHHFKQELVAKPLSSK